MTQTSHSVLKHFSAPLIILALGNYDPDSGTLYGPILPLSQLGYSVSFFLCASCKS